ncbi:DNA mismatch repair protein MutS [Flavobacteriaceae sp. LMIT009]
MSFKIGDIVEAIDEAISGKVISINGNTIAIETADGFPIEFSANNLMLQNTTALEGDLFASTSLEEAVSFKESKKPRSIKKKPKERYQPTFEVDLHIGKLLPSTKGMTKHDILTHQLNTAKRQLEFAIRKRIQKMVFIHGVGEGVLKLELEYLLKRYNVKFYDANYQKYGLGATEVYIYQN